MSLKLAIFCCFALIIAVSQAQFLPFVPGTQFQPGQFVFGGKCKSKGCGIQSGPFGDIFFGGGCKSKGCPIPPGFKFPGVPATPLPPAPPVCCTPDGCLNGYRTECLVGALSPRLIARGFFVASGSCSGRLSKFRCKTANAVCTGNRNRCKFRRCPRRRRPVPRPLPPRRKKPHHHHSYRMSLGEVDVEDEGPVVDTNDRYMQLIDRMINMSNNVPQDILPSNMRQFGGGFGACKSKGCPFGVFPGVGDGRVVFGGACKSKGCGIINGVYFGGACKSKGCPVPPGFQIGTPTPQPSPSLKALPPHVPDFKRPSRRDCCFSRPCDTQRICRCVLNN